MTTSWEERNDDLMKMFSSIRTSRTGAVTMKVFRNGKIDFSVGGNTIQDLMRTITHVVSEEISQVEREAYSKGRQEVWQIVMTHTDIFDKYPSLKAMYQPTGQN